MVVKAEWMSQCALYSPILVVNSFFYGELLFSNAAANCYQNNLASLIATFYDSALLHPYFASLNEELLPAMGKECAEPSVSGIPPSIAKVLNVKLSIVLMESA